MEKTTFTVVVDIEEEDSIVMSDITDYSIDFEKVVWFKKANGKLIFANPRYVKSVGVDENDGG